MERRVGQLEAEGAGCAAYAAPAREMGEDVGERVTSPFEVHSPSWRGFSDCCEAARAAGCAANIAGSVLCLWGLSAWCSAPASRKGILAYLSANI